MPEYQDKVMEKLLQAHRKDLKYNGEYILGKSVSQVIKELTAEEILIFDPDPSSPQQHALKKKIITLYKPGINKDGMLFDQKAWDFISDAIEKKRKSMLGFYYFYVNKYDSQLKKLIMDNFSYKEIAYYHADSAGYNLPKQKAQKEIYSLFIDWLKKLDKQIEQNPYMVKLLMYNEGRHWESRYMATLDDVMTQLLEIDVTSYEMSVLKMRARKIPKNDMRTASRALNIIYDAQKRLLTQNPKRYDIYHRIRAVNGSFVRDFAFIDGELVINIGEGLFQKAAKVSDQLYFIEQGKAVLFQTNNPDSGKTEFFIFRSKAPYVQVVPVKNDYSRMFRENVKDFIAANFSQWKMRVFLDYISGEAKNWNQAYNISVILNEKLEKFFYEKYRLTLDNDAWFLIVEVINEYVNGKKTLSSAEVEFLDTALPFSPVKDLMRLTRKNFGFLPLPGNQLFETRSTETKIHQSI
jgi:hypothetical protein